MIALGLLLLSSVVTFAQIRVGVTGGVQLAAQRFMGSGTIINSENRIGFQAGLLLDAPIVGNLSVRPQFLYSMKGAKYNNFAGFGDEVTIAVNYLEVPIQLTYGLKAGPGSVILGVGPYVAYALNGKVKTRAQGQSYSAPIEFGENQQERLDFGLRLSASYELTSGLQVTGYYAPGLRNLSNEPNTTARDSAYGLSMGYLFGSR